MFAENKWVNKKKTKTFIRITWTQYYPKLTISLTSFTFKMYIIPDYRIILYIYTHTMNEKGYNMVYGSKPTTIRNFSVILCFLCTYYIRIETINTFFVFRINKMKKKNNNQQLHASFEMNTVIWENYYRWKKKLEYFWTREKKNWKKNQKIK